ncbi:MAG: hypothetical protein MR567_08340 [Oscillospiraceae bacterium]|nr:hypothetical protein [Oscillospiraceae bacterium]
MKKLLSVLLSLLLCAALLVPAFAAEPQNAVITRQNSLENVFSENENSLIVFVTGIGQSFSYRFDESYLADGAFPVGTLQDYDNYAPLIASGKYEAKWNLLNNDFSSAFSDRATQKSIAKVVASLIASIITRRSSLTQSDVDTIIKSLFSVNILDENGNGDPSVVTPRYTCPVSDYPGVTDENGESFSEAKSRFYSTIPCAEIAEAKLGSDYEDYLYCYNYCAFSNTDENVKGLKAFIDTAVSENKVGAKKVVLVPMSMGASVVSAYLAKYPLVSDNHVRRVVSIVGCWNGSDLVTDLINKEYVSNSADLFYNGVIGELVGEPWGYLVNMALRIFPKAALRDLVDKAVESISKNLILNTPSLMALVPSYDYESVRPLITSERVKAQTDEYYAAQSTLKERLSALEKQGVTFSFISGYGLSYGEKTSDYKVFSFMKSAESTNSDEIINVSSTAPGTSYVKPGTRFEDESGRVLSPDGSIDISTAYYPDSSWYFYGQKHELENNGAALRLAIDLALGKVKTVSDCDNMSEDGCLYPQFNNAEDLKKLNRSYIPDMEAYLASGKTLTEQQQAIYDKALAVKYNTVNDPEKDEKAIEALYDMMVGLGIYEKSDDSFLVKAVSAVLKTGSNAVNKIIGPRGFIDLAK